MRSKKGNGKIIFNNLLLLTALVLWVVVIVFAYMVLKNGGHLNPKAADLDVLGTVVNGMVVESGGMPLAGAKLSVLAGDNKNIYITSELGKYRVLNLLEGEYSVVVSKQGYSPLDAKLVVGHSASVQNFTLTAEIKQND